MKSFKHRKFMSAFVLLGLMAITSVSFAGGGSPAPAPEPEPTPDPAPSPSERADLRVMAYNIMQLPVQDWDQTERANRLPDAIRALADQPDVIAFSEVLTDEAYAAVQAMSDVYPFITPVLGKVCSGGAWDSISGNCSNAFTVVRGGVVIASKHPILAQHAYIFNASQVGTADYQANKGAVYAEIEINSSRYHVVATHTQATHSGSNANTSHNVRVAQAQEIRSWVDGFSIAATDPVIVAGDLNVAHDEDVDLEAIIDDALNATLWFDNGDAAGYQHSYPEANWMSRAYNYYFDEDMCYNKTLDYVVTLNGYLQPSQPAQQDVIALKAANSWYWSYLNGSWSLCGGSTYHNGYTTDLSDHYPVVATYKY